MHHGQSRREPKTKKNEYMGEFIIFAEIEGEYKICIIGLEEKTSLVMVSSGVQYV